MSTDTEHAELEELIGAYVLDALDPDETARLERHLDGCPRCRSEVDAGREIAGQLGTSIRVDSEEPLPPGLWDRIAENVATSSRRPPEPMPGLADGAATTAVVDLSEARAERNRWERARWAVAAVAVAAVVAVVVLGTALAHTHHQLDQATNTPGGGQGAAVHAALATPDHRTVTLSSPEGAELAEFVVLPSGQGYMVWSKMPSLPTDETYQLWAIIGGQAISTGLLGHQPQHATFTLASTAKPSELAVTVEPAGGVTAPNRTPVASGGLT
jgi:anti-sigma factor RsiW